MLDFVIRVAAHINAERRSSRLGGSHRSSGQRAGGQLMGIEEWLGVGHDGRVQILQGEMRQGTRRHTGTPGARRSVTHRDLTTPPTGRLSAKSGASTEPGHTQEGTLYTSSTKPAPSGGWKAARSSCDPVAQGAVWWSAVSVPIVGAHIRSSDHRRWFLIESSQLFHPCTHCGALSPDRQHGLPRC